MPEEKEYDSLRLIISPEVRKKMDRQLILEENLKQVLFAVIKSGQVLQNPAKDSCIAHLRQGYVTFWTEYRPQSDGSYVIENAYYHRLTIAEGTP